MPRKRKILTEVEDEPVQGKETSINPVAVIVQNAQTNEAFHNKYIKELQLLYTRVSNSQKKKKNKTTCRI